VLNLKSVSEIHATLAAVLANANVGTPLNPNLTTQQLWDEFYEIVRQTPTDIESIIVNQMMKFVFAPPAPGGAGANTQVIFNDGGALAGDAGLTYNKATDALTVNGTIQSNSNVRVTKAGSDTFAAGPFFYLNSGDGSGNGSALQLNVTNGLDFWNSTGGVWTRSARLDINGQFGLGVIPNTWSQGKVIELGSRGNAIWGAAPNQTIITANSYYDGSWKYAANGTAANYEQGNGVHFFYSAGVNTLGPGQPCVFGAPKMQVDAVGNVSLLGNLVPTSGKGIDFSATSHPAGMTSELLNDYEEGTFTVGLSDLFGNDATVSAQTGRYTKIGRRVFCFANITLSNKGAGAAGNLPYITGLPFPAVRTEGSVVQFYANTSLTTNGQINFQTAAGNNVGNFTVSSSTTGTTFLTFAQITNTTQFIFCVSYDV
jgi:hypothetical protein